MNMNMVYLIEFCTDGLQLMETPNSVFNSEYKSIPKANRQTHAQDNRANMRILTQYASPW